MRSTLHPFLILLLAAAVAAHAQAAGPYRGRSVQDVVEELREAGLPLVYSSNLLPSTLIVDAEPQSSDPLAIAREILRPHGLTIRESGGALLVVRGEVPAAPPAVVAVTVVAPSASAVDDGIVQVDAPAGPAVRVVAGQAELGGLTPGRHVLTVRAPGYLPGKAVVNLTAGQTATATVMLVEAAPKLEELTVTASRYDMIREIQPSVASFSREQIESLSELGDDTLRIAHRLPGIAANEFSARSHVRGGAADEMSVIFDGIRIIEPFHLRDYQGVFSAVDQRIVSGIQLYSGGFPAEYGDALSGLTVIEQREPTELVQELGLSFLYTSALSSGTFRDGRSQWLVSARRGNIDRLLKSSLGDPSYRDAFVHLATALGAKHRLVLNAIGFDDDIVLTPENSPNDREEGASETDNHQSWLKLDSDWTEALTSRMLVYSTRFTADRRGMVANLEELLGVANDRREMHSTGLKQDWRWDGSDRQWLTWGLEAEQLDGSYRYTSAAEQRGVLATLGPPPPARNISLAPGGESYSAYFSDRVRVTDRLIMDLGVRWDRQTYLPPEDDEQFSPRASVLYRLGSQTDLRVSYGQFFQSEGLLDLQVEDGVLEFATAQRATHSIAGVEHRFGNTLAMRVEVFHKWTHNARPRYENLFDPLELLPELRPGRVQVSPERAESRGLEIFVSGERPVSWWANYSLARVEDVIDGTRVPRGWDQRDAASAGVTWDAGPWSFTGVATLHSGWPATTISLETVPGPGGTVETVAVAGERNADRLESLQRLDFHTSRTFMPKVGSLRFFAELTNVTNRKNPCCLSYQSAMLPNGTQTLERIERDGLSSTANVGLLWEF